MRIIMLFTISAFMIGLMSFSFLAISETVNDGEYSKAIGIFTLMLFVWFWGLAQINNLYK